MGIEVGQRVADYKVLEVLGSGGMGRVYRVCNVISGRTEAMKVLRADLHAGPDEAERFRGEIRTLAGLCHPNIAQLHTALQHGDELLMIMEFVEGSTLHQLAQRAPLSPQTTASYMQQVLTALSYAHSRGVVHRDIKPANIMIAWQGVVKLTDFGIAKSEAMGEFTGPGSNPGSLNYMSPEQALCKDTIDERSDIYSLGITLYELLTGMLPFDDESANVVLLRQVNETPRPPIEINPQLSKPLSDLIMKALEKDPAQRFQTAGEFSDRLAEVTGVAASEAVLIAGGFSEVTTFLPGGASVWASAKETSQTENKRHTGLIAAALATAIVCAASMAVGVSAYVKGGLTGKDSDRSTTESSQLPAAASDEIVSGTDDHPILANVAVPATTVEDIERSMASAPPAANGITTSSISPGRAEALTLHRTPDRAATLPRHRSQFREKVAGAEASALETPADTPKAKPELSAATTAELQDVRRQKDALEPRANAIRSQMARLRKQKIADGADLKQGMADAYVDMNLSLSAGSAELEAGNASAARSHVKTAADELSILEKLFSESP